MESPSQYHVTRAFGITISQTLGSLHESKLELYNVNCTNVGYYYCVENSVKSDANLEKLIEVGQASKIYLFAEGKLFVQQCVLSIKQEKLIFFLYTDPECRLVPPENPIIDGNLNEEVVIPCKPTSKKTAVELIKEDNKVNKKSLPFFCWIKIEIRIVICLPTGT